MSRPFRILAQVSPLDAVTIPSFDGPQTLADLDADTGSVGVIEATNPTFDGLGNLITGHCKGRLRLVDDDTEPLYVVEKDSETLPMTEGVQYYLYLEWDGTPGTAVHHVLRTTKLPRSQDHLYRGPVQREGAGGYQGPIAHTQLGDGLRRVQTSLNNGFIFWAVRGLGARISNPGTLKIIISDGQWCNAGHEWTSDPIDTSVSGHVDFYHQPVIPGDPWLESELTDFDADHYDNGSGTLAHHGAGAYGVFWCYLGTDGEWQILYGQGTYATLADAEAAGEPSTVPSFFEDRSKALFKVFTQQGSAAMARAPQDLSALPAGSAAATSHNSTLGLQGGSPAERYHLNQDEHDGLTANSPTPANPAITESDARLPLIPTADEKAALVGTSGTAPSAANPLVDDTDTRLSDSRAPTAHQASHVSGADQLANLTHTHIAAANKDGTAATASMRTLGTGALQACAGNDTRLSDSRAPTGAAGGDLSGSYPNPGVSKVVGVTPGTAGLLVFEDETAADIRTTIGAEASANKGAVSGYCGLDAGQLVATVNLGSGSAGATNWLRGDRTWAAPTASQVGAIATGTAWPSSSLVAASAGLAGFSAGLAAVLYTSWTLLPITGTADRLLGTSPAGAPAEFSTFTSLPITGTASRIFGTSALGALVEYQLGIGTGKVAPGDADAAAATASLRTLGTSATSACAGNDSRLTDSRAPTGSAGGDLSGTYPNPNVAKVAGTTPGAGGLAVLDDATVADIRTTISTVSRDFGLLASDPSPSPAAAGGDTYTHTTIGKMAYDATRAKWLSVATWEMVAETSGNTNANAYFVTGGLAMSATSGRYMPWNGTITAMAYTRSDNDAMTFEVYASGVATGAEVASSATSGSTTTLNNDFTAGAILALRNKAGGNTVSNTRCIVRGRWRA